MDDSENKHGLGSWSMVALCLIFVSFAVFGAFRKVAEPRQVFTESERSAIIAAIKSHEKFKRYHPDRQALLTHPGRMDESWRHKFANGGGAAIANIHMDCIGGTAFSLSRQNGEWIVDGVYEWVDDCY